MNVDGAGMPNWLQKWWTSRWTRCSKSFIKAVSRPACKHWCCCFSVSASARAGLCVLLWHDCYHIHSNGLLSFLFDGFDCRANFLAFRIDSTRRCTAKFLTQNSCAFPSPHSFSIWSIGMPCCWCCCCCCSATVCSPFCFLHARLTQR